MKHFLITFFCFCWLLTFGQVADLPPDNNGCWAKCAVGGAYDAESLLLPVFVGKVDNAKRQYLEEGEFHSFDSELIVTDTSKFQKHEYEWKQSLKYHMVGENETDVWRRDLCPDAITTDLVKVVQQRMHEAGFFEKEDINGSADWKFGKALLIFQMENELPQGGMLNLETLDFLGIEY